MKTYDKYKPSGIDWLGDIPSHWDVKRLKYCASINDDVLNEDTDKNYEMEYVDISSVQNGQITGKENYLFPEAPSRARRMVKDGDIIVSTVRTYLKAITRINKPRSNMIVSTGFAVVRPQKINSDFLGNLFFSEYLIAEIISRSVGVSYPAINSSEIGDIKIPLPPPSEQPPIANYLDEKTVQIDKLITNKQKLIKLLKEERTSIINEAVSGKGKNWEKKKLKYIALIKYGLGQPPKQKDDGLPLIRATNVERGKINEKDLLFVDPDDVPYDRDPVLKENDIIVVRSGAYTADSAIIPKKFEGAITGYDMVVRVVNDNPFFIAFCLLSEDVLINQLYLHRLRAAQPHLNKEELGETILFIPSKEEQTAIVRHIENETQKIDNTISKIEKEIELMREYRTALISEVVTGKVDVREHNLKKKPVAMKESTV